jgi:hypothetical protein
MTHSIISNEQLQALVNNLAARAPKTSITVLGKAYLASKLAALAQSVLTARSGVTAAKEGWKSARDNLVQVEAQLVPIVSAVRLMLVPMLGNDTGALAALAVSPRRKANALTSEERLTAVAKARATRIVRGTLGKAAKARLKGNVTGVVVTPVTSQTASAPMSPAAQPSTSQASQPAAPSVASTGMVAPSLAASVNSGAAESTSAAPTIAPLAPALVAATNGAVAVPGH